MNFKCIVVVLSFQILLGKSDFTQSSELEGNTISNELKPESHFLSDESSNEGNGYEESSEYEYEQNESGSIEDQGNEVQSLQTESDNENEESDKSEESLRMVGSDLGIKSNPTSDIQSENGAKLETSYSSVESKDKTEYETNDTNDEESSQELTDSAAITDNKNTDTESELSDVRSNEQLEQESSEENNHLSNAFSMHWNSESATDSGIEYSESPQSEPEDHLSNHRTTESDLEIQDQSVYEPSHEQDEGMEYDTFDTQTNSGEDGESDSNEYSDNDSSSTTDTDGTNLVDDEKVSATASPISSEDSNSEAEGQTGLVKKLLSGTLPHLVGNQGNSVCQERLDLYILFEVSDTIRKSDFEVVKGFLVNFIESRSSRSRIGLIAISDKTEIIIPLNNSLTTAEMKDKIIAIQQSASEDYRTGEGLLEAIGLMHHTKPKYRGAPRVVALFSAYPTPEKQSEIKIGQSTGRLVNITSLVINIGSAFVLAREDHLHLGSFEELNPMFLQKLRANLCKIPQILKTNEHSMFDDLRYGEVRYFSQEIEHDGDIIIEFKVVKGSIRGWYHQDPSFIENDIATVFEISKESGTGNVSLTFASSSSRAPIQIKIEGTSNTTSSYTVGSSIAKCHSEVESKHSAHHPISQTLVGDNNNTLQASSVGPGQSKNNYLKLDFFFVAFLIIIQ